MSILIPHTEMNAEQVVECSYHAQAIIVVCRAAADGMQFNTGEATTIASAIDTAFGVALELIGPIDDALERRQGMKGSPMSELSAEYGPVDIDLTEARVRGHR
jgi:hypothetical protein